MKCRYEYIKVTFPLRETQQPLSGSHELGRLLFPSLRISRGLIRILCVPCRLLAGGSRPSVRPWCGDITYSLRSQPADLTLLLASRTASDFREKRKVAHGVQMRKPNYTITRSCTRYRTSVRAAVAAARRGSHTLLGYSCTHSTRTHHSAYICAAEQR